MEQGKWSQKQKIQIIFEFLPTIIVDELIDLFIYVPSTKCARPVLAYKAQYIYNIHIMVKN
jgi:hypothetical protein